MEPGAVGTERVGRYVRMVARPGRGGALADTLLRVAKLVALTPLGGAGLPRG